MKYIEEFARNFGQELIKPKKYNYSQQLLEHFFADNLHLSFRFSKVYNKRKQALQTLLVKNCINNQESSTKIKSKICIIYAHGLGSNKLQVLPIIKYFKNFDYDICSFDFSGSGKSEGNYTSYGLRQQDDICAILAWLDSLKSYDNYILWGRSMGAVAIILSQGLLLNPKVKTIILDSPFSSFQKICIQIASKKSLIPELFLEPLVGYLKQYFSNKAQFNLFRMDIIDRIKRINRKILFLYAKNDSIVSCSHSQTLKLNCSQIPSQIQISEDHNMQRSKQTHKKIHEFIEKNMNTNNSIFIDIIQTQKLDRTTIFECFSNRRSQSRNRGISLTSKNYGKQNIQNNSNQVKRTIRHNSTKINLSITQSVCLRRSDSKSNCNDFIRIKPVSSVDLGRKINNQFQTSKQLHHPLSVTTLNSMDTIESNIDESNYNLSLRNENKIYLMKKDISLLDQTQKFTKYEDTNKNKIKLISQLKQKQNMNTFYTAPFMDEDLNMIGSINSICLNRRKFKQKQLNDNIKLYKYQTNKKLQQNLCQQNFRPSIQLRRKNRFLL